MSRPAIAVSAVPLLACLLFAVPAAAHDYSVGDLTIDHPWSRPMPGGARVGGGFMTIENGGEEADRLVSASSPRAGRVEIHETTMENDVMRMRPLAGGVALPAGGTVTLEPGGLHVMFLDVGEPFAEGDRVPVTLVFERAGEVEVEFAVEAMGGDHGHDHHDHDHDTHSH